MTRDYHASWDLTTIKWMLITLLSPQLEGTRVVLSSMSDLPYWDHAGNCVQLPGFPEHFNSWSGSFEETPYSAFFRVVERCLEGKITAAWSLGQDMNSTFKVELDNGSKVIVKQSHSSSDALEEARQSQRAQGEINILRFLRQNTALPVPEIRVVHPASSIEPFSFIAMELMPGRMLWNTFPLLSREEKETHILSYADFCISLFRVEVPQVIGSTLPSVHPENGLNIVPMVGTKYLTPHAVYESLEDYLAYLFRSRRLRLLNLPKDASDSDIQNAFASIDETSILRIQEALNKAEAYSCNIISHVKPSLRRCVLRHDDPTPANILTGEHGRVTAVIDWELHSIQPSILAVEYPRLLSYEGIFDPSYAQPNWWWQVSREEAAYLCDVFRAYIKTRDEDYYEALVEGNTLRLIVDWIKFADETQIHLLPKWLEENIH